MYSTVDDRRSRHQLARLGGVRCGAVRCGATVASEKGDTAHCSLLTGTVLYCTIKQRLS
jgi:hypothetical protein